MSRERNLTPEEVAALERSQAFPGGPRWGASDKQRARGLSPHKRGVMTKAEAQYEMQLRALKESGLILWYAYEPLRFRIGTGAFYCPDFIVWESTSRMIAVEVKGGGPIQEASLVRIKAAAQQFPCFMWVIEKLAKGRGAGFQRRVIG